MGFLPPLVCLLLVAGSDKSASDQPNIPALVKQLGADTFAARDEATKKLAKIGPPAMAELRKALRSDDIEVCKRAKKLLLAIEQEVYGERHCFETPGRAISGVAFSPCGKFAAQADSRGVRLWDLAGKKLLASNEDHTDRVMSVAFSPDGKLVASASEDRTVRVYKADTLEKALLLRGHTDFVRSVVFTSRGQRVVSAGFDGRIIEWDVSTGKETRRVEQKGRRFLALVALPGERLLATAINLNTPEIWELGKKSAVSVLTGHEAQVSAASVTADSKFAITGGHDQALRHWDLSKGKVLRTIQGNPDAVTSVALTRDGAFAVSGGFDKSVRLWDVLAGSEVRTLGSHLSQVWCVAVSPDGKRALSGANDGTLRYWSIGY